MGAPRQLDLRGIRVLVVEDIWHVGKALKGLLENFGAEVVGPAPTASEAERLIAEHAPHIALVDVKLRGGVLAYDLIDVLVKQNIAVIVTSGYTVLPQRLENVVAILQKPYTAANLQTTLRQVVPERPAR
jgi:CheY-like chemotaxis protein